MNSVAYFGVFTLFLFWGVFAQNNPDKIDHLPDFNHPITFNQYAGYVNVDPSHNRNLFYWFVESQNSPSTDPVTLWLNGGPGCSSLEGQFYENGPFHFERNNEIDLRLYLNPWSWNRISNVIYLEAPAGVGFSYSDDHSDYNTDDVRTARDNLVFLQKFFEMYPSFRKNDFYIAGESYAGIYVPSLAMDVLNYNKNNSNNPSVQINLKGILVGNGVTVWSDMTGAFLNFTYGHALYPTTLREKILRDCVFPISDNPPANCANDINTVYNLFSDNNIYDIYTPCYNPPNDSYALKYAMANNVEEPWMRLWRHIGMKWLVDKIKDSKSSVGIEPPCVNSNAMTAYLNNPDIRKVIHAAPINKVGLWTICSGILNYTSTYQTVVPFYNTLIQNGIRAIAYSGDVDGAVPYTSTEQWTRDMGRPLKKDWSVWKVNKQVAGYITQYDGLTFLTVKNSGHMVPQYQPENAFVFYEAFLRGQF